MVYVIMFVGEIASDTCYLCENMAKEAVDKMNKHSEEKEYWYKELYIQPNY